MMKFAAWHREYGEPPRCQRCGGRDDGDPRWLTVTVAGAAAALTVRICPGCTDALGRGIGVVFPLTKEGRS